MSIRSLQTAAGATAALVVALVLGSAGAASAITHDSELEDGGFAAVSVEIGAELAGQPVSVLIMDDDADHANPAASDIVFVNEYTVSAEGVLAFRAKLPTESLAGYVLAVNVAGDSERYLMPLDETVDPGEPGDGDADVDDDADADADVDGDVDAGTDADAATDGDSGADGADGAADSNADGVTDTDADAAGDGATGDTDADADLAGTGVPAWSVWLGAAALLVLFAGVIIVLRRRAPQTTGL